MTMTSDPWGQRQILLGKGLALSGMFTPSAGVMDAGLTGAHGDWA